MPVGNRTRDDEDDFYDSLSAANKEHNLKKTNPQEVEEAERQREQHHARERERAMQFFYTNFADSKYMKYLTLSTTHVHGRLTWLWIGFNRRTNQFLEIIFDEKSERWQVTVSSAERMADNLEKARKQDRKIRVEKTTHWGNGDDKKQHTSYVVERDTDPNTWKSTRAKRDGESAKSQAKAPQRQEAYKKKTQDQEESTPKPDDASRARQEALEAHGQLQPKEIAMLRRMIEERKAQPSKDTNLDEMRAEWEKLDHMLMALLETLERKKVITYDDIQRAVSRAHVHIELGPDGEVARDAWGQPKQTVARISRKNYTVSVE